MTTITASDLKQNSMRLQDALREDLLVTKRDKPFVVVMDYEKYRKLEKYIAEVEGDAYPSISFEEACDRVTEAVETYRSGKMKTLSIDEVWTEIDQRKKR
jgi:prevent-host-death family protein